jgi:hypothetical protein
LSRSTFIKLILAILILSCSVPAWAASPLSGFNGARLQSLGNAYVALADDAYSFYLDPAGLTELKKLNFFSTYSQLDSNTNFSSLGVVAQHGWFETTFGLGYRRLALTGLQTVTSDTVDFIDHEIGLALAKEVSDGLSIGVVFRCLSLGQSTGSSSADASGRVLDLAVRRVYQPWLRLALSVQDLAGRLDYQDGTVVNLPYNVVAGASLDLAGQQALIRNSNELTLNFDVSENRNDPALLHAGLEWHPIDLVAVRAGVDQSFAETQGTVTGTTIFNNLTAGLGLCYGGVTIDYAMRRNGDASGDITNYLSVSYAYTEPVEPANEETIVAAPQEIVSQKPAENSGRKVKIKHFPDVPKDFWARKEIELLATAGLMWGYTDGAFHPQDRVTRGSLEIILSVGRHLSLIRLSDEQRPVTRAAAAQRLKIKGRVERPSQLITRAELAVMIYQTAWGQSAIKRLPALEE